MAIAPDLKPLYEHVDKALRGARPDRYVPGDSEWLEVVAEGIPENLLPEDQLRQYVAREIVGRRETQATKRANRVLRMLGEGLPFDYSACLAAFDEPISILSEREENGKVKSVKERVRLAAAGPTDMFAFAQGERGSADRDHKIRLQSCDGAEYAGSSMQTLGFARFDAWVENQRESDG